MGRPALLLLGVAIVAGPACATRGAVPRPFPGATSPRDEPPVVAAQPTSATEDVATVAPEPTTEAPTRAEAAPTPSAILSTALSLMGTPYRNGGSDPAGFDCSGLVQWVFAEHGAALPREVRDQYRSGFDVPREELRPGDLVFFSTVSRGASHVGIVVNDREFVHAPSSRGVVRLERLAVSYWATRFVGARRVAQTLAASTED